MPDTLAQWEAALLAEIGRRLNGGEPKPFMWEGCGEVHE